MTRRISVRADERHHDSETVLIHMGAGAEESLVTNAVSNYHHYRGLAHPELGMLCVSVFGLTAGVTREDIFAALPQGQFGEATWEQVRALFDIWPTTISDPNMPEAIAAPTSPLRHRAAPSGAREAGRGTGRCRPHRPGRHHGRRARRLRRRAGSNPAAAAVRAARSEVP